MIANAGNTAMAPQPISMRNMINTQVYSFKHPDFLTVAAMHGPAHLAMYDQAMWDKYQLTKIAGPNFMSNTFIVEQSAASADPKNFQDEAGVFSLEHERLLAIPQRLVVAPDLGLRLLLLMRRPLRAVEQDQPPLFVILVDGETDSQGVHFLLPFWRAPMPWGWR